MSGNLLGEIIALTTAALWTITALAADMAARYASSLAMNVVRMLMAIPMFLILLWVVSGSPVPSYASLATWGWLALAGLVGYVFGDLCLFNSYRVMGSRYGQLFMTLAPVFAAVGGFVILGEVMQLRTWLVMFLILGGIAMSVCSRDGSDDRHEKHMHIKVPFRGVLFGLGAAAGQGIGLVISKIGMDSYAASLPVGVSQESVMMPFAATFIRCVAAMIVFLIIMMVRKQGASVVALIKTPRPMFYMCITTFFGPFVGVSLSLLAIEYTSTGIASTLLALVPVFILLPSWLFFGQKITALDIVGTLVAVSGVALLFL